MAQPLARSSDRTCLAANCTLAHLQAKSKSKAPYSQYDSLQQQGAKIVWGNPSDSSAIPSEDFDVVYDNNGKDMDACKPLIDAFKVPSCIQQSALSPHPSAALCIALQP